MIILVTGYDQTIEAPFGADFIRYIKADFDQPSVTVIAVPRDIWLKTNALQAQKIGQTTIGRLFFYSYRSAFGQPADKLLSATTALTQTLYDAFLVVPDHYVTVNLYSFAQLVDAVGGVNVNIPQDLIGGSYRFYAGDQLLDGNDALLYVRALPNTSSEWDRINRQNLVLRALRDKVFSPSTLPKIPDLIKIYQKNLVTDLSFGEFIDLACLINQVSLENITFSTVSPGMVSAGPQGSLLPDIEKIKTFLLQQLGTK
jgi:LCP family protein required for cell wall assembly